MARADHLGFWHECQNSSPCRLRASSFSLRLGHARGKTTLSCFLILSRRFTTRSAAGMQHTACGILPNEQIEVRLHRKRNSYDYFIASGNTRSTLCECELINPKLHQYKRGQPQGLTSFILVETTGLEPVTPCMSSKYSNQLSYASVLIYYTYNKISCQGYIYINTSFLSYL